MVVPSAEIDFVSEYRRLTYYLQFVNTFENDVSTNENVFQTVIAVHSQPQLSSNLVNRIKNIIRQKCTLLLSFLSNRLFDFGSVAGVSNRISPTQHVRH